MRSAALALLLCLVAPALAGDWNWESRLLKDSRGYEFRRGVLTYQQAPLPPALRRVRTPIGEFVPRLLITDTDPLVDWVRIAKRTLSQAGGLPPLTAAERERGFYRARVEQRRAGTPAFWLHAVYFDAWVDPLKARIFLDDCAVRAELTALIKAMDEYYLMRAQYPNAVALLVTGPEGYAGDWPALVDEALLADPWGTTYRVRVLAESQARDQGRDYVLISAGPDRKFETDDDLALPEPNPAADAVETEQPPSSR